MARYVILLSFTAQGGRAIRQSAARAQAFNRMATKAGVKVEAQFWTVGHYDGVLVLSAKSNEPILRCLAQLAALGNVKTESLQAFDEREFKAIVRR